MYITQSGKRYTNSGTEILFVDKFENIPLGSFFSWGVFDCIKTSNDYDYTKDHLHNVPNAVNRDNFHYLTFNPHTTVLVTKVPEDYVKREPTVDAISIEWLVDRINETEDKLFELTKDKNRSHSLDEIRAFTDLDIYAYTLKKIYSDYTGERYEGNHYMLRGKENVR